LPDNLPSHKWLGYFRKMSLLTELDSFTPPFLQICQSYGLRRLRVLRATKNSNALCPKRLTQNDFGTAFVPNGTTGNQLRSCGHASAPSKKTARKIMSRFTSAAANKKAASVFQRPLANLNLIYYGTTICTVSLGAAWPASLAAMM
jgi:hypothetical protein